MKNIFFCLVFCLHFASLVKVNVSQRMKNEKIIFLNFEFSLQEKLFRRLFRSKWDVSSVYLQNKRRKNAQHKRDAQAWQPIGLGLENIKVHKNWGSNLSNHRAWECNNVTVNRTVASDTRRPGLESCHRQLLLNILTVNWAGNGPFIKTMTSHYDIKSVY